MARCFMCQQDKIEVTEVVDISKHSTHTTFNRRMIYSTANNKGDVIYLCFMLK